ncbi:hypothetical protein R1sor_015254 [Riccia sorocarpa]|uniref:Uncharacterized protein n=1 Tax=Riccia sorocarpa TaxID=122646 RepID=A0ABD3HF12_9MARC
MEGLNKQQVIIKLMDTHFLDRFKDPIHEYIQSNVVFQPYSFKDNSELDLVEYSGLRLLRMLPYLSTIQRHCIASDVFFWGVFHADVEGERLLITGMDGSTNVIGWNEIMVSLGAEHAEDEEFRSVKIMHKQLLPYRPCDFLPETVERNPNRELVNGGDYEEVHFYKEAAPYGPTFYLMFVLRSKIANLQKLGKSIVRKAIPIVWAPLFMHILYWNRAKIFAGSSLEDSAAWVQWQMTTKEGDITLAEELSTDLSTIILQKYGPILGPLTDAAEATLTWKAKFLTLEEAGQVAVEDARKIREEREKKIQDLQAHLGSVTTLWNSAKSNCEVKETQLQKLKQSELAVQAELEKLCASSKTTESKLKAELAAVRAELTDAKNGKNSLGAAQAEVERLKLCYQKLKSAFDSEMDANAGLQAQIQALKDEAASQKFKLDRAEQAQHEARTELATVKKQLRMSQLQRKYSTMQFD